MVDIFMPADQYIGTSSQTDGEGITATAEEHEFRINEPSLSYFGSVCLSVCMYVCMSVCPYVMAT